MRGTLLAMLAVAGASLLVAADASPRGIKQGGTFRVAVVFGSINAIDPVLTNLVATVLLDGSCGTLMAYPDKPPPAGYRLAPSLAEAEPVVSRDGRTYTFTIRKDARFSTGAVVTARAFARALERGLAPAMQSPLAAPFGDIVGAQDVIAGKAMTLRGVVANGRALAMRLTKRVPDLRARTAGLCAVPPTLPADPEGAKAPLASAGPYYIAEYVPNERLVLERNRFYRGERPQHVDRIVADLAADAGVAVDQVASGTFDTVSPPFTVAARAAELTQRYGVNKSQFFVVPGVGLRVFHLNTSRPLFRKNPKLRQAVNFAVDRRALAHEAGLWAETPTDQYLLPARPGYRNERIYPLKGPDVKKAKQLAKGHTRGGKAVLYTTTSLPDAAMAQILQRNLKAIGIELEIKQFPGNLFEKLATPGEPFDLGRVRWFPGADPAAILPLFDGRTIGALGSQNWSYFNSPKYNRLLDLAARLTGAERNRAYGDLDVLLSRDLAPAIPVSIVNAPTFVSARIGCIALNPWLDLTAVCLK